MTTIAYKAGLIASDSSCLDGDINTGASRKIWRAGKCLVGFCGEFTGGLNFLKWYKLGADDETSYPWGGNFDALVVLPDGSFKMYEQNSMEPIEFSKRDKYIAIGSGAEVALGCMFNGGTAKDAVRAAVKFDTGTKGPIRTLKL